jgi:hypothetical protein
MGGEADLTHSVNKFLCIEKHLIFIENAGFHILDVFGRFFSIVRLDQSGKYQTVLQVCIKV